MSRCQHRTTSQGVARRTAENSLVDGARSAHCICGRPANRFDFNEAQFPEDCRSCPEVLKREREARLVNRIEPARGDSPGTAATPADKASARGGGGRKAVLAAIEAVLVAKRVPEKQREAVMAAATEKLAQRIRDGQAPKVKVYDKAAPSQRPAVMPTPEVQRTRERAAPVR